MADRNAARLRRKQAVGCVNRGRGGRVRRCGRLEMPDFTHRPACQAVATEKGGRRESRGRYRYAT